MKIDARLPRGVDHRGFKHGDLTQKTIGVFFEVYNELNVGDFEADLLVEKKVLLELKTVRTLDSAHEAQLLNYLRATEIEVGLLLNFGPRPQFKRMVFDNPRKAIRANPCLSAADLLTPDE